MEAFPHDDSALPIKDLDLDGETIPTQGSLGLLWEITTDTFTFSVPTVIKPFTRRGVLSTVNSVFDPLGLLAPVTIQGRALLRELTSELSDWDTPLPEDKLANTFNESSVQEFVVGVYLNPQTNSVAIPTKCFIAGDDDPNVYRVEVSCGHAVDPISLTEWCRIRISEGHFKFHCPALTYDTNRTCGKEWSYVEVRRNALLSVEEWQFFEEKLAILSASSYCEYKQCPRCGSYVERKDETNISVICLICMANDGIPFKFCWQCMKEWKGPGPCSDKCDNEGCINIQLEILKNCDTKTLPYSNIRNCPKVRACPTCGLLIEHQDKCKYLMCIRCHVEFCFACLNTKAICSESSEYSRYCAIPVATRQTSIPVWNCTEN
ncbi:uncharacterized protein DDB_G0292642-like [Hypanus sabinus]|uniref:uncharacterized protein DDB_G0292642-like n=1 Tax=Hypanus sabinus TaxID=79690 RepID=UPI0028C4D77C|nr:uncharacterized protein DDB_G0292642-like [Hypanus sabinus]